MKKLTIILVIPILGFVLNSCGKDRFQRLPKGDYESIFTVQCGNLTLTPCYGIFEVKESTDDYLIVTGHNDTLYRTGNTVTGILHLQGANRCTGNNRFFDVYSITGTISKENGFFYIKGGLSTKLIEPNPAAQTIDTLDAFGTFELKSNF
jgi:hypothetical protein